MIDRETALAFDAQDLPLQATEAYEEIIAQSEADLESFLSLAVLYFVCTDGGYIAHHGLSNEFVDKAWERAKKLLDMAEIKFGKHTEINFWRRYFRFVVLGEEPFIKECEQPDMLEGTLIPYFYLFSSPGGEKYCENALKLFELIKDGKTAKKRYIKSILEKRLFRL